MGRFNIDRYDVRSDSSPDTEMYRTDVDREKALVLVTRLVLKGQTLDSGDSLCGCGCLEVPKSKGAKFAMGHDIRLRGKLIRAHLAGRNVVLVERSVSGDEAVSMHTALDLAAEHSTDTFDWAASLKAAESTQGATVAKKLAAANRDVLTRATGVQEGDRRLIKVGRWEYTGQVMAIYAVDGGTEVEVEYVTAGGDTKTVRKNADELKPVG